jgi:hypothetical protein
MKNWASSSRLGSIKSSRDATLTSSIGSCLGIRSILACREWVMGTESSKFFPSLMFNFLFFLYG